MTLLEVLVSMFVLAVGLLGLASLLPVATYYKTEASKYDRASTLAQAVYHDMQLHGYLQPKTWLDTTGNYAVIPTTTLAGLPISYLSSNASGGPLPFLPPVVIDPLAIGYAAANGQIQPSLFPAFPVPFFPVAGQPPVQLPGSPTIYRLTLDSARSWPAEEPLAPGGQLAMVFPMAKRLFMSNDDLIFQLPASADYRPQVVTNNGLPPPLGVPLTTPDFQGDYSWLLTVSPDIDDIFQSNAANMDRFTVSVVIFYKRDLNLDQNPNPALTTLDVKKAPPERMVFADLLDASAQAKATGAAFPFGINFSGGAVRLRTPVAPEWLDVKPNEWLMLSGLMFTPVTPSIIYATVPGVPAPGLPIPFCQWYRIAAVGETLPIAPGASGTGWYCDVQLAGPDWNNLFCFGSAAQSFQYAAPDQPNAYLVQFQYATLCAGAIAVYDNTVTLDDSLLKD